MSSGPMIPVAVGGITLAAPIDVPRHVEGQAGDLWEWTGDGDDLLTLVAATRRSHVPDAHGVSGHLTREIGMVTDDLDDAQVSDLDPVFAGAVAGGARIDGTRDGIAVRHLLAVATDGQEHVHLVHAVVRATDEGHALGQQVLDSLALAPAT